MSLLHVLVRGSVSCLLSCRVLGHQEGGWCVCPALPFMVQNTPFLSVISPLPPLLPSLLPAQRVCQQRKGTRKPSSAFLVAPTASPPEAASCPSPHLSAEFLIILGCTNPAVGRHITSHLQPIKSPCFRLGVWLL